MGSWRGKGDPGEVSVLQDERMRVAVAMSGGVDSSVAAALLVDQGHEVIGLTARMWKEGSRCCSLEDIERARKVALFLDMRHVVVNALDLFARCVADRFAAEYVRGRTPSPCVVCNEVVKFGLLLTRAAELGCSCLATGHYARVEGEEGGCRLFRASDASRDQSYFLHRLSQRQLGHALFPLGNLLKQDDVVPFVRERGLPLQARGESRDVCFAEKGRHHEVVERFFPGVKQVGDIVDASGMRLGEHEGIHRYTVGQRRGVGVACGEPLYVTRLDARGNVVEVGRREDAMSHEFVMEDARWISGRAPDESRTYGVQVRYRHDAAQAKLAAFPGGRFQVRFMEPQFAIAPGQAAVFYDGDEVLGGGWIGAGDKNNGKDPAVCEETLCGLS